MGYAAAVNYLYGLQKHGIKLGLDNTISLLSLLDNPQNYFQSIHIAGTNGKGSTSAIIASILQAAGFRTGLFTSPHLVSFTERIRVNNEQITESDVVSLAEEIRFKIQDSRFKMTPTFFELVTAMGFLYFKRKNIDWAVVETGMGGRLDATNVLLPEASVITSIGYDHREFLGNTLSAIAEEKAGIIKNRVPVITSAQEPSVMDVIKKKADEKESRLFVYGRDFSAAVKAEDTSGSVFNYNGGSNIEDLAISLPGRHQVLNASLALKTIEIVSKKSSHHALRITYHAIRNGLENIKWHGRLEFVSKEPPILIDGAHNPSAAEILAASLKEIFLRAYRRIILIIGVMSDKDIRGIMAPLLPLAAEIILTAPACERAASPQKLADCAAEMGFTNTHIAPTVKDAIDMAIKSSNASCVKRDALQEKSLDSSLITHHSSLILITGSFYTIGEAKEMLCGRGILSGLRETV
ncbi:MAG: bifunctional folylpolyglutamate synthase/dihydrofolate synthase [Nitrospinae bacterium]|nr:bifunctional folylpolyglutamate synthase/dihydrofolate synthase [Nitrospinota bacterium]